MESVIKLISALAQILWPILGFTTLFLFRKEIAEILRRIKKGKMLGQEIELSDSIETLRVSVETVKETTPKLATTDTPPINNVLNNVEHDEIKEVLDEASRSPRVALITLGGYIEIAARRALASIGTAMKPLRKISAVEAVDRLNHQYGGLPGDVVNAMRIFMDVRNKIVHTREATDEDIISALDSGITLLRTLKALPYETLTVLHHGIPLYADEQCNCQVIGTGVIIEFMGPGKIRKRQHILPTMCEDYEKGQNLTLEWDLTNIWGETWYVDPESGHQTKAWISSGEFKGRPLDSM
ncbi:hypothetical protein [Pseudomonas sp. PAMC 26793]|uniref:hypothetical protein n=1 Tax=Pseudomonas sp. PAMC 26793 TaxID=1240676 RepID=UPI00036A8A27|nr:hypothetical protein [Pseudomonas sp. PAMC 26793]